MASKVDQDHFQVDLAASQAINEELRRTNEELRRSLQQAEERAVDERAPPIPPRARPMSFSQAIMDAVIPATSMGSKVTFTDVENLEAHLRPFHTQMMLTGGSDAVYCKLFMSTLAGTALEWFVSLLDGHITTFDQFSMLFREQFLVNKAPPPISYDVFDVKQLQGEFLNRFGVQVVRLNTKDEAMTVHAFTKEALPGPFSDSLIRYCPKMFFEIWRRAIAHIVIGSQRNVVALAPGKIQPYETRKPQTRGRTREDAPPGTIFE